MSLKLKILDVLVYYDLPHVFTAKDNVGTKYICLLVDDVDTTPRFICVGISDKRLSEFMFGRVDLRTIFLFNEIEQWYIIDSYEDNIFFANIANLDIIPEAYLPNEGFFLPFIENYEPTIVSEVLNKDSTIIHLSMSDVKGEYSIDADILGDFVKIFQSLIKYVFKKSISYLPQKDKKLLDQDYNYKLRAFASSLGSFNIHFETSAQKEIIGSTVIERALHKIDDITKTFVSDDEYIDLLQNIKGHSISSYKKLISKIIDEKVKIKYCWFSPAQKEVHMREINTTFAERVHALLSLKTDLSQETKEFFGYVKQADVKGNWRILNEDDEKEYSGLAKPDDIVGITLETKRYRFICEEKITLDTVTDREKSSYYALSIEEINSTVS